MIINPTHIGHRLRYSIDLVNFYNSLQIYWGRVIILSLGFKSGLFSYPQFYFSAIGEGVRVTCKQQVIELKHVEGCGCSFIVLFCHI